MKNLNRIIEKATMPNLSLVTLVNKKSFYSLCAVLCLLICTLSTKAKSNFGHYETNPYTLRSLGLGAIEDFEKSHYALLTGSNSGYDFFNAYELPYHMGFTSPNSTYFQNSQCTSCSPFTNNYGDTMHSGNNKWIHIVVADSGYLTLQGGTSDFDSVFYLLDSSGSVLTSEDDGYGSSNVPGHGPLQPQIQYYVSAGDYYLLVDGTDKFGASKSGTVNVDFVLGH